MHPGRVHAVDAPVEAGPVHQHASWSPYDLNGGTVLAIAGSDYCIVAGSTRLSTGYSILTRDKSKLAQISQFCVVASGGFQGDIATLTKNLKVRAATCCFVCAVCPCTWPKCWRKTRSSRLAKQRSAKRHMDHKPIKAARCS